MNVVLTRLLQIFQEYLHLAAHLGIERRERLVEQEQLWLANQGPGQRNTLLLSAGQL